MKDQATQIALLLSGLDAGLPSPNLDAPIANGEKSKSVQLVYELEVFDWNYSERA